MRQRFVPQQNEQRLDEAPYGSDGPSVGCRGRRGPEIRPEQFVGAVDEVQLHWTGLIVQCVAGLEIKKGGQHVLAALERLSISTLNYRSGAE